MGHAIRLNGQLLNVEGDTISYEQIVELAGLDARYCPTVVYSGPRKGDWHRSGTMSHGKSIELEPNLNFSAMYTGNA